MECLGSFLTLTYFVIDLAENIFTVYEFSDKYSFELVYFAFISFDVASAYVTGVSACFPSAKCASILDCGLEVAQALVYLYFCDFSSSATTFFAIAAIAQCAIAIIIGILEDCISDGDRGESRRRGDIAPLICCSVLFNDPLRIAIWSTMFTIPFVFTSADSIYNQIPFQLILTVYVWITSAILDRNQQYVYDHYFEKENYVVIDQYRVFLFSVLALTEIYFLILFVFSMFYYYDDGSKSSVDYWVNILGLVYGGSGALAAVLLSFWFCGLFCSDNGCGTLGNCIFGFFYGMGKSKQHSGHTNYQIRRKERKEGTVNINDNVDHSHTHSDVSEVNIPGENPMVRDIEMQNRT